MKAKDLKLVVKEKYGEIAEKSMLLTAEESCCGTSGCCNDEMDYAIFADTYSSLEGYNADADLKLGCGMPTKHARISKGDRVLDLGSGAGNDAFIARTIVGDTGGVTGLDFTDEMIARANKNLAKTKFENIEFVKGDIENMPLPCNAYDVVISNCVLNLVPDKQKAFKETYRVLKPGGHFCVSDVLIKGEFPESIKREAELYVGCISGAINQEEYIRIIEETGFKNITVHKEEKTLLPLSLLQKYLSEEEMTKYENGDFALLNITISGTK